MGSVVIVLRLLTSAVLILSAWLARGSPTAVIILLALGVTSLVFTVRDLRKKAG